MIQDITPHQFHKAYQPLHPASDDQILHFDKNTILMAYSDGQLVFPLFREWTDPHTKFYYLFAIDESPFFLALTNTTIALPGYEFHSYQKLKDVTPKYLAFAGFTGYQFNHWYLNNRFCGKCRHLLQHHTSERMLLCPACKNRVYPHITPAVMIAVTDGDRLLLIRQSYGPYRRLTLVAGFAEVGETIETSAHREVMEEVGLRIKNLSYYKSQPWPFTDTLMLGFYAELDGDDTITLDPNELTEAEWVRRRDIEVSEDEFSLTNEMILGFKNMI